MFKKSKKKKSFYNDTLDLQTGKIGSKLNFQSAEAYKLLRTNLMFSFADEKTCRVIGFTSSVSGEGKTLTVINTAYSMAQAGSRVLVIECDLRLPTVSKKLALNQKTGITNVLTGRERSIENVIKTFTDQQSKVKFDVMCAGDVPPTPSELLGSGKMAEVIEKCSHSYDYILLDNPPVNEVSDVLVVSKLTDGIVLVVRQDVSDRRALAEAMRQLKFAKVKMLGFVFNDCDTDDIGYYKTKGYYKGAYKKSSYET